MSIYLDYNATAPLRPEVQVRMAELLAAPANPSAIHSFGRAAKKILEDSRKTIAEAIGAFPNEVIFTATGSEANAMALKGFPSRRVLVSAVEHSSVIKLSPLEGRGSTYTSRVGGDYKYTKTASPPLPNPPPQGGREKVPVNSHGIVNLAALEETLADGVPSLVSIMLANNETGVIQPIRDIADICKKHGALLHTDAVQALGKIPVEFTSLGCDMMTISGHKMGGPVGAAALIVRQDLAIAPLFIGGGQELGRRAGTENIAAIAGFAKAVELIDLAQMQILRGWLEDFEERIIAAGGVLLPIPNPQFPTPKLPNTSCIAMPSVSNEVQLMDFDMKGFAISAGSACSSGRVEPSPVLAAMGVDTVLAGCAIRVSGGWNTQKSELDAFLNAWQMLQKRLKAA